MCPKTFDQDCNQTQNSRWLSEQDDIDMGLSSPLELFADVIYDAVKSKPAHLLPRGIWQVVGSWTQMFARGWGVYSVKYEDFFIATFWKRKPASWSSTGERIKRRSEYGLSQTSIFVRRPG